MMRSLATATLVLILATAAGQAATFEELAREAAEARRGNHVEEAVALYRQALETNSAWAEGWWFLGTLSYAAYRYSEGEEALSHFVKLDEKRGLAWALLGLCEFETGKYDRALEHLQRGLAPGGGVPPDVEAGVRFHYGLLLTRAGVFDRGRRELEGFAQGCEKEPMLLAGIGLNALHQSMLPKDVAADKQDLVAKAGAAACAWMLRFPDKTESGFRTLLAGYPAAPGVHYLYGTYLLSVRPDEAKGEFSRELELSPSHADAHAMLSLILMNAGDLSAALAQAKKAVEGESAPDALSDYAYGEAMMRTGSVAQAVAPLETAARLDPESLDYHMALAGVYSRVGRNDDARRERHTSLEMAKGQNGGN